MRGLSSLKMFGCRLSEKAGLALVSRAADSLTEVTCLWSVPYSSFICTILRHCHHLRELVVFTCEDQFLQDISDEALDQNADASFDERPVEARAPGPVYQDLVFLRLQCDWSSERSVLQLQGFLDRCPQLGYAVIPRFCKNRIILNPRVKVIYDR